MLGSSPYNADDLSEWASLKSMSQLGFRLPWRLTPSRILLRRPAPRKVSSTGAERQAAATSGAGIFQARRASTSRVCLTRGGPCNAGPRGKSAAALCCCARYPIADGASRQDQDLCRHSQSAITFPCLMYRQLDEAGFADLGYEAFLGFFAPRGMCHQPEGAHQRRSGSGRARMRTWQPVSTRLAWGSVPPPRQDWKRLSRTNVPLSPVSQQAAPR